MYTSFMADYTHSSGAILKTLLSVNLKCLHSIERSLDLPFFNGCTLYDPQIHYDDLFDLALPLNRLITLIHGDSPSKVTCDTRSVALIR